MFRLVAEVAFRIEGGSAALSGGRDGLAVSAVGDIASGEDAGQVGFRAFTLEKVAVGVHVEFADKGFGVGGVSDRDEHAFEVELRGFSGDEVFDFDCGHFAFGVGDVFFNGGVPNRFNFGICEGAIGHDFRCAERVSAVDEVNLGREAGEEGGFFAGGVAAADDADGDIAVEGAVAGGAGGESVADKFFFAGEAEPLCARAGGDDKGLRFNPFSVDAEADIFSGVLKLLDGCELEACAEAGGLRFDVHDEVGALDAFGEAWKVFNEGCGRELSTGLMAFENEWGEVGAGGVHGGGEASAA